MIKRTSGQFRNKFGKLVKGISSFLLEKDELSDVQNMLPGYEWRQRKGQSELTIVPIAANLEFKSMFQFTQLNQAGDYLLAHVYDPVNGDRIVRASALPPATGITWVDEYTLTAGGVPAQFAQILDAVIVANDKEFLIWRGESHWPTGVWVYDASETVYIDYWDEMTDGRDTTILNLSSFPTADRVHIMSDMPFDRIGVTVGNPNSAAAVLSVFTYQAGVYTAVAGLVDGTSVTGRSISVSGDITWNLTGNESQTVIDGQGGFVAYLTWNNVLDASCDLTAMDMETEWGEVQDVWDGDRTDPSGAYVTVDDVTFEDYLVKVLNTAVSDYLDAGGLPTAGYVYVGFNRQVNAIDFWPDVDNAQTNNSSVASLEYWSNTGAWTAVTGLTDTTEAGNSSWTQKGSIGWKAVDQDVEKARIVAGDINPWYWYRIKWDAAFSAEARIYRITGIPTPRRIDWSYGCTAWKRRAWQIGPNRQANTLRFSADGLPNTFNGADSGYIQFGERPVLAAIPFFNELVIWADKEMWMLQGDSPASFGRMRLSARVGIDAPHSAISVESGVIDSRNIRRITLAWFFQGIWFFDGIRWWIVSSPDIDSFFDAEHEDYINPDFADRTYGDYDLETECAYWIVYSGVNQTTPNKVLVMHIPTLTYGIFKYETEISSILSAFNKRFYLVGGAWDTGKHYLLNDTDQDVDATGVAVAIDAFMITKDMWAQYDHGLKQRVFSLVMESQDQGMVELDEYPDGSKTPQATGSKKQTALGKTLVDVQWQLKEHPGQLTTKFRIRHRSLGDHFIPYGYSTTWDQDRSEE